MKRLPGPHNQIFTSSKSLELSIRAEIRRHKLDLDPSNPRDYIDNFLIEEKVWHSHSDQQNCWKDSKPDELTACFSLCSAPQHNRNSEVGFEEENLVLCCLDLFLAGSETTSKTLQWGLIFFIKNPHVQGGCLDETICLMRKQITVVEYVQWMNVFCVLDKVQAEIDRVIGQTRQPTMADKPNLPYTDAVIHEIQRMGNIVPLNGLRMAAKDTILGGYFIPKVCLLHTKHRSLSRLQDSFTKLLQVILRSWSE